MLLDGAICVSTHFNLLHRATASRHVGRPAEAHKQFEVVEFGGRVRARRLQVVNEPEAEPSKVAAESGPSWVLGVELATLGEERAEHRLLTSDR